MYFEQKLSTSATSIPAYTSRFSHSVTQVQLLQKQLHGIQLDRALGTQLMLSSEHPYHTVLLRDLKAQLDSLKAQGEEPQRKGRGTDQQPTYEIYARTDAAKFAHLSKVRE